MSDEHVAPEGAQYPRDDGWWDSYSYTRALVASEPDLGTRELLARIYSHDDLLAARAHADRMDRIVAMVDAAEHDPGTPEAWADGCECERQHPRADEWEVRWGCPMHDPREA